MIDAIDITCAPIHPLDADDEPASAGIHLVEVSPGEFLPYGVVIGDTAPCAKDVVCALFQDIRMACKLRGIRKWACKSVKFVSIAND